MARATQQIGEVAIVIGGSMAGLLAARILAERYNQVLVLERDPYPTQAIPRKGVPQAQHAHALLARGQQILAELFPGLMQQLFDLGAIRGHGHFFSGGGTFYPGKRGPGGLFVSRPLLEAEVRTRLLAMPDVRLMERCNVQGLVMNEDGTRVSGVRVIRREEGAGTEIIAADLVVDASGRGSRMAQWLELLGYPAPEVEIVEVDMGYASRFYRREPEHLDGALMVNIAPTFENKRACGMMAQEGDRWIVTLAGYFGDYPPTDEAGFLAFAKSLPIPAVYETIRTATPLSAPVPYKFMANQRRRYERLARFPAGLLVFGDAICSFTPIYGQGMSVAALEALELRKCLALGSEQLALRFFRQVSKVIDVPWSLAVGNDRRLAATYHPRAIGTRVINWYMDRLQVAARHDPEVAWAFLKVANLLAPPSSVLQPSIALRVARDMLRRMNPQHRGARDSKLVSAT